MADPRGNHDHVTRLEAEGNAPLPAQAGDGRASVDAEYLVAGAVVVVKRKYAVAPASDPMVRGEQLLEHLGCIMFRESNGSRINEQRQARIVGDVRVGHEQV